METQKDSGKGRGCLHRGHHAEKVLHQRTGKVILCYGSASGEIRLIHTAGNKNTPSHYNWINTQPKTMLPQKLEWGHFYLCPGRHTQSHIHHIHRRPHSLPLAERRPGLLSTAIVDPDGFGLYFGDSESPEGQWFLSKRRLGTNVKTKEVLNDAEYDQR